MVWIHAEVDSIGVTYRMVYRGVYASYSEGWSPDEVPGDDRLSAVYEMLRSRVDELLEVASRTAVDVNESLNSGSRAYLTMDARARVLARMLEDRLGPEYTVILDFVGDVPVVTVGRSSELHSESYTFIPEV